MSLAALGDYSDSEEGSECSSSDEEASTAKPAPPQNFFEAGEDEEESEGEGGPAEPQTSRAATKPPALPSARSVLGGKAAGAAVFATRYGEEAASSKAVLEQHVGLTKSMELDRSSKARVCFKFRDGRGCRKGERCPFSHVVAGGVRANEAVRAAADGATLQVPPTAYDDGAEPGPFRGKGKREPHPDSDANLIKRAKIRAGVGDTLQPPRKARAHFARLAREGKE